MDPNEDDVKAGQTGQSASVVPPEQGQPLAAKELRPVRPGIVTAADAAASSIRDAVLTGLLEPGSRVTTADLAAGLGVSRQPVREALRKLEAEGFIERGGGRSHIVRQFSAAEMEEVYYLRRLLEAEVAYLAASRLDDSALGDLRELNDSLKVAIDSGNNLKTMTLNADFHRKLRHSIGMPMMASIVDRLWIAQSLAEPFVVPERGLKPYDEHEAIMAALAAHDAEAAKSAMEGHISRGESDTMAMRRASEDETKTESELSLTTSVRTEDGETVTETKASPESAPIGTVRVARDERGKRTPFEDLEIGRDLGSMEFLVTQEMVDQSCERREDYHEWYSIGSPWGGTIAPTILNYGPPRLLFSSVYNVRGLFYKYEFENFYPIRVGKKVTVTATLTDKWVRNNREFVAYEATYVDEDGNKVLHTRRAHALDYIQATEPKTGVGLDSGILR